MSLRQEILKEIKNILNEATAEELNTTKANVQIGNLTSYFKKLDYSQILKVNPATATDLLEAYYVLFSNKEAKSAGGITVGNALQIWQTMNSDKKKAICQLGNESGKYSQIINLPSGGTITLCEKSVSPSPVPAVPEKKQIGRCKPPFVGRNGGIDKGPPVQQVQEILSNPKVKILAPGFSPGIIDDATNKAIFDVQKGLATMGKKIASGLGGTYEGGIITPDGCYGPKTSCAVSLFYQLPDMYNKSRKKCLQILKITLKDAERAQNFEGPIQESKNWIDKTREGTASNLLEKLTKAFASKKVL